VNKLTNYKTEITVDKDKPSIRGHRHGTSSCKWPLPHQASQPSSLE